MEEPYNDLPALKKEPETARNFLVNAVHQAFYGKSLPQVKTIIHEEPEDVSHWLTEISLETESYEAGAAAQQVFNEKRQQHSCLYSYYSLIMAVMYAGYLNSAAVITLTFL